MGQWRVLANRWQKNKLVLGSILAIFVAIKTFLHFQLDASTTDFLVDVGLAAFGLFLYWDKIQIRFQWEHLGWLSLIFCFGAGYGFYLATIKGFSWIPFDYSSLDKQAMLLVGYPVVEELAYRFAILWMAIHLIGTERGGLLISCILFGLFSSWESAYVPTSLQGFLYFKGIVLVFISTWWAFRYLKTKSLIVPIGLHLFFKMGFFTALTF